MSLRIIHFSKILSIINSVNFANSIGVVRPTNWGTYFTVRSVPNANDLAYTSLPLKAHTDNPYRKPVPCVQLLHCIDNEVKGGFSIIIDGFAVADYIKKKHKDLFNILTKTKVRFRFIDKNIILETKLVLKCTLPKFFIRS